MENNKKDHKKGNRKRGPHEEGELPHSLYPLHENRKMEGIVRERHQEISGEVGNQERTKDGTNKMRDMSKGPSEVILHVPGGRSSP